MSQKKPKSKSKDNTSQKPPKDKKSKKEKNDDTKSKKSIDKDSKKPKSPSKKSDKLKGSKISKIQIQSKIDLDESQDISFFKPVLTQHLFNTDESLCLHHKERNSVFCQICQQPGCQQCIVYGPHNNQMHRINKIDESFKARYLFLNQLVCGELIERRDRLNKRLEDLTIMSDELRYVKSGIQKITKIQYNEMLERLRTSGGGKFAVLHHQMAELQKDLQSINALAHEFGYLTNMKPEISSIPPNNPSNGMIPFLLRSKYLQQQAEQLISKPIKTAVDVYPYDLPRQLTQKKIILDKNKRWIELLQIKDQAIWTLVQDKKTLQKGLWEQFDAQAQAQFAEWSKLKDKIDTQLKQYQMTCTKCHTLFSEDNINDECVSGGFHEFSC